MSSELSQRLPSMADLLRNRINTQIECSTQHATIVGTLKGFDHIFLRLAEADGRAQHQPVDEVLQHQAAAPRNSRASSGISSAASTTCTPSARPA